MTGHPRQRRMHSTDGAVLVHGGGRNARHAELWVSEAGWTDESLEASQPRPVSRTLCKRTQQENKKKRCNQIKEIYIYIYKERKENGRDTKS